MLKKIDHIGIAVTDMDVAIQKYSLLTGAEPSEKETVDAQMVETSFFPVGDVKLELLSGTEKDSPVSRFVEKKGPGIHHICFEVEDLDTTIKTLSAAGLTFIDLASNQGAGGTRVAFLHPKSTGGILFEFAEHPTDMK